LKQAWKPHLRNARGRGLFLLAEAIGRIPSQALRIFLARTLLGVIIAKGVAIPWVSARAIIRPGHDRGAVVAAGSVVIKDAPPMTILGGIPAKPIGEQRSAHAYDFDGETPWSL
jgi:acetyltransferase-like isoleucine patch superfamily enzyme